MNFASCTFTAADNTVTTGNLDTRGASLIIVAVADYRVATQVLPTDNQTGNTYTPRSTGGK